MQGDERVETAASITDANSRHEAAGELPLKPFRLREARPRFIVITQVRHQSKQDGTTSFECRASKELSDGCEQVFGPRRFTVGESWRKLELGWLAAGVRWAFLRNDEGRVKDGRVPTPEEYLALADRVVEVGFAREGPKARTMHDLPLAGPQPDMLVPPGECLSFFPSRAADVRVRCRRGEAQVSIYAVPE